MFSWIKSELLNTILNCIYDGIIIVDEEGNIIVFNNVAEQLLGFEEKSAIGKRIDEIYPNTKLYRVLKSGLLELNQAEYVNNIKLVVNRIPIRHTNDEIMGVVAIFHPFSEVRNLQKELSSLIEARTLLQAIINSTHDAISVVDEQGKGILINPAYTELTGLSEKDVINQPATIDIPEGGESMHLKVLATRKPVDNVRMILGPNKKDVIVNVAPIFVNDTLKGSVGVVHDVSEIKKLTEELADVRRIIRMQLNAKYSFNDIIGSSIALKYAIEQAQRAAITPATVLLRGESGTGKELFAHAIHNASQRSKGRFMKVNCAALTETLLESELFGYSEGAFTGAKRGGKPGFFEEADGGTLFLDEVGELSFNLQSKLLRVLQEKEIIRVGDTKSVYVDVRVVVATNANLEKLIESGKFREDLYYRINMIQIMIPPLRHRNEDIPELSKFLIKKLNHDFGRNITSISAPALEILNKYHWPGNVRELENILGRAIINMKPTDTVLDYHHLPNLGMNTIDLYDRIESIPAITSSKTYTEFFEEWEKMLLSGIISNCNGNKTKAAKTLNISIRSLYYKLQKHNLDH